MSETESRRLQHRKGHEERLAEILAEHGDGVESYQEEESAFEIVERRAASLGLATEELVMQDLDYLRRSEYPGEECLEPYEIELYVVGALEAGRLDHASECSGCRGLLAALAPGRKRMESFLERVRREREQTTQAQSPEGKARWSFVQDAFATTVPVAAGAIGVAATTGLWGVIGVGTLVSASVVAVACGGAALLTRASRLGGFLRSSGGALVGGSVAALAVWLPALWGYTTLANQQWTSVDCEPGEARDCRVELELAQSPLTLLKFLRSPKAGEEQLLLLSSEDEEERLLQLLAVSWIARESRAGFSLGTVTSVQERSIVVRERGSSRDRRFAVPQDVKIPDVGEQVMVVFEPDGKQVGRLYRLGAVEEGGPSS